MNKGDKFYNASRGSQVVQLIEVNNSDVVYQVIQGNFDNSLKEFRCSKQRFNNLYVKIGLSFQNN